MRGLDDVVDALADVESLLADRETGAVQDSLSRQHQMRRYEAVHTYVVEFADAHAPCDCDGWTVDEY